MHTRSDIFRGGRCGPVRKFRKCQVFAYEGMVVFLDDTGDIDFLSPQDAVIRAVAVYNELGFRGRNRAEEPKWRQQEWDEIVAGCREVIQAAKEAKAMGDPTDPLVQAYYTRHARKTRTGPISDGPTESDVQRFHAFKGRGGTHTFHQSVYHPRKVYRPLKK